MNMKLSRRAMLKGGAAATVTAALPVPLSALSNEGSQLRAGAASRDITPANGDEFHGYVRPDMRAEGVSLRLFAHALVLDDGQRKVALVAVDLGEPMVKSAVVERVRHLGFQSSTVLLSATHTHAGPFTTDDWTAHQIAEAITAADAARRPARAGWAVAGLIDANRNRAIEAHLANHGQDLIPGTGSTDLDPDGPNHARDLTLRLLRVDGADGTPLAAWAHFSVHPTAFIQSNTTFSADFPGVATRRFRQSFGARAPIAMFSNGTQGDLIPLYDDYNQHAVADRMGHRVAQAMRHAWQDAGRRLAPTMRVDAVSTDMRFEGQEVEPGKRVSPMGFWGLPFFGGAQNGPSPFYELALEGKRRPAAGADPVHGRKILVSPAPWRPANEVQALLVGDRLLLGVPGEPTVEAGRRIRRTVTPSLPGGVTDLAIIGLANAYAGYFTTPEEYDQQHYEGGHTVFGKWSLLLLARTHAELAAALRAPSTPVSPTGSAPQPVAAPTGAAGPGELTRQPPGAVERMQTLTVAWTGGQLGRDRPVDAPFIVLERSDPAGWRVVDDDLGFAFVWREKLGDHSARYDVAVDWPTGLYRMRVLGGGYELITRTFHITASTFLRLRGVTMADGRRLQFSAQLPPPDPEHDLLSRPTRPRGGRVRFSLHGAEHEARWDPAVDAWVATVPHASAGDEILVGAQGLVDGLGNMSGAPVRLRVGQVADLDWPPNIGPAGGRPPGPFGVGTFPP